MKNVEFNNIVLLVAWDTICLIDKIRRNALGYLGRTNYFEKTNR